MDNLKKFSIDDLKNYKGSICLYSTNFESNLGDNVKNTFKNVLTSNVITYNISLATKNECNLILIDGDDFSPPKVAGLVKAYETPIVIFVGTDAKLEKLKKSLLVEPLLIDKNTCKIIDIKDDIERNIEEKRKRDELKALENPEAVVVPEPVSKVKEPEVVKEKVEETVPKTEKNLFFADSLEDLSKEKEELLKEIVEQPKDEITEKPVEQVSFFDFEVPETNKEVPKTEELFVENKEQENISEDILNHKPKKDSFFIEKDLSKTVDFTENKKLIEKELHKDEIIKDSKKFYYKDTPLEIVGIYSNDFSLINTMKEIFGTIVSIDVLNDKNKYDIVIVDITFALPGRVITFLEHQNCPAIVISKRGDKLNEFMKKNTLNVLSLEKPISIPIEIIRENFSEYLKHFDKETNINKDSKKFHSEIERANSRAEAQGMSTNYDGFKVRNKETVKSEINKTNKRPDKSISLEEIYEKMGLNDISIFKSNINNCIFTFEDNKMIKYSPEGYLIEYRIKRLESQGLPKEEINELMKQFEESDIRFQKRILQNISDKQKQAYN